jgi:hypothetical protein
MCRLATQELYFENHLDTRTILDHLEAVEIEDIAAFNRDYLSRQFRRAHLAVAGPIDHEPALRSRLNGLMNQFAWRQNTESDNIVHIEPDHKLRMAACLTNAAGFGENDAQQ